MKPKHLFFWVIQYLQGNIGQDPFSFQVGLMCLLWGGEASKTDMASLEGDGGAVIGGTVLLSGGGYPGQMETFVLIGLCHTETSLSTSFVQDIIYGGSLQGEAPAANIG